MHHSVPKNAEEQDLNNEEKSLKHWKTRFRVGWSPFVSRAQKVKWNGMEQQREARRKGRERKLSLVLMQYFGEKGHLA